jgi:hypothetical protein
MSKDEALEMVISYCICCCAGIPCSECPKYREPKSEDDLFGCTDEGDWKPEKLWEAITILKKN